MVKYSMPRRKGDPTSRSFTFTWNNYTPEDVEYLKAKIVDQCAYGVFGFEEGDATHTPHLQGMVHFINAKTKSAANKFFKDNFNEFMKADAHQAAAYCRKDGDFFEHGIRPMTKAEQGLAGKRKYQEALELARAGRVSEIEAGLQTRYYRTYKQIAVDNMVAPPNLDNVCGVWFYGPPGTGKSHTARSDNPGHYLKALSKWWDGYRNEDVVVLDEFEKNSEFMGHYLKLWADKYPFLAEVKGSSMMIRPKKFIVCSNYAIEDIFQNDEVLCQAIKRRFKTTHFSQVFKQ